MPIKENNCSRDNFQKQRIRILKFSYLTYNLLLSLKFLEVLIKKYIKFILLTNDNQKRRFFWERLGVLPGIVENNAKFEWIWIHANAIGEVNACVPLVNLIKEKYPNNKILLTTANFSADNKAGQLNFADKILFFPYDIPFILRKILKFFNPVCVIIVESDIWPNFIKACKHRSIPVFVVSGVYAQGNNRSIGLSYIYNYAFRLSGEVLGDIDYFYMQTNEDANRLSEVVPDHKSIVVTGNLKFSSLNGKSLARGREHYRKIFGIKEAEPVFIAGNVHKQECERILDAFIKTKKEIPGLIIILAMRFIEDVCATKILLREKKLNYILRTYLDKQQRTNEDVILLDTMGELSMVYAVGNVAFVGGSLVYLGEMFGGHNILEPAALGVPVLFGPFMHNFKNLSDLFLNREAAIQVDDEDELACSISRLLKDKEQTRIIISNANNIFEENKFVAQRTFSLIDDRLKQLQNN